VQLQFEQVFIAPTSLPSNIALITAEEPTSKRTS